MAERMWRVVTLYRVVTLIYAGVLILVNDHKYAHPAGGLAVLAVMTAWTAVTAVAYARPPGRSRWLIGADLAVSVVTVLSTRWVESAAQVHAADPTLPTSWAAAPVLACAVAGGPWIGLGSAVVLSAALFADRPELARNSFSGAVLLLIAGGPAAMCCGSGWRPRRRWTGWPGGRR